MKSSVELQLQLQRELTALGKITRSGATTHAAYVAADKVAKTAKLLCDAVAAEVTTFHRDTKYTMIDRS